MTKLDLKNIKALFLDMDGVLWSGKEEIGDLEAIFDKFAAAGLTPLFGTNNATRTPQEYCTVLAGYGVHVSPEQFFTSGIGAIHQLHKDYPNGLRLHIFGSDALKRLMREHSFELADQRADAVLVSMDKGINYERIALAMRLIHEGAKFYATNTDSTLATEEGWRPGGGVMVKAVETCAGVKPFVIGKPNTVMIKMACEAYHLQPNQILAVGDRHETDIMSGSNAGAHTALVLTGYETKESAALRTPQPDIILPDLTALANLFEKVR